MKIRHPIQIHEITRGPVAKALCFLLLLGAGGAFLEGCAPREGASNATLLKDLRPFTPRSPAAEQEKIDNESNLDRLVEALSGADAGAVMRAAAALGETGSERAVGPLIGLLENPDPSLRFVASEALIRLGDVAVTRLTETLARPHGDITSPVAEILGRIGNQSAVPALAAALERAGSDEVRLSLVTALGAIGGPAAVDPLVAVLRDRESVAQFAAVESLAEIGEPSIPRLKSLLKASDPDVVLAAVETLGKTGLPAALPPLVDLLGRRPPDAVRMAVVRAMGQLGNPEAVPVLAAAFGDPLSAVKRLAADALAGMGAPAVPALLAALESREPEDQDLAAAALAAIGETAVAPLVERLAAADARTVWSVMDILGRIGAAEAVPAVAEKLGDPDPDVAIKAAETLGGITAETAVAPLIGAMKDPSSTARLAAAEGLVNIGAPAVPDLVAELAGGENGTSALAADALRRIGAPAVDPLAAAVVSEDRALGEAAADVLAQIGAPAVEALGTVLIAADETIRAAGSDALVRIGGPEALRTLVSGLSFWHARRSAAAALAAAGWQPADPEERILFQLARGERERLIAQWDATRYVLMKKMQSAGRSAWRYALNAFIALGNEAVLPRLIDFLETRGDAETAALFLASGQPALSAAAEKWTAAHTGAGQAPTPAVVPAGAATWDSMRTHGASP